MQYSPRAVDQQLKELLSYAPAVALEGAKAVGKTSTAMQFATTTLRLDSEEGRQRLAADPQFQSFPDGTILLDEWQRFPESWDLVRRAVDAGAAPGRFILTGSATPSLDTSMHSGAGRILTLRMRPMALCERLGAKPTVSIGDLMSGRASVAGETESILADYAAEIARTGFPGLQKVPDRGIASYVDSYIRLIVERDLPEAGYTTRDRNSLLAWMRAYAAATGTQASYNEILDLATPGESDKPAKKTTQKYREKLAEIWVTDPLPSWNFARNPFPRVSQTPTHFLTDPALALNLLGLSARTLLQPRHTTLFGLLFEALAVLTVRVYAEANFGKVGHFRTRNGDREVDCVIETSDGAIIPVEIKLTATPTDADVRHLLWLKEQLPDDVVDMVIVTTGQHAYRRPDGVAVVPLALLGA